jgi:hypothetical protein
LELSEDSGTGIHSLDDAGCGCSAKVTLAHEYKNNAQKKAELKDSLNPV